MKILNDVFALKILLVVSVIFGITMYASKSTYGIRSNIKKLDHELDSLRAVNLNISFNLLKTRNLIKKIQKEDSITIVAIVKSKNQDKELIKEQQQIIGSFKNLTSHQLLDSLHRYYEETHH